MSKFFLAIVTAFIAPQVIADDVCENATSTFEINQCGRAMYDRADNELNLSYKRAIAYIDEFFSDENERAEARQAFVLAQRAWIDFRDKDCNAVYELWKQGTIRGSMYWGCMTSRTEQRVVELNRIVSR